jgi:hypothetical protein
LFGNAYHLNHSHGVCKCAETPTTEKEWFINLFPEANEWPEFYWKREFGSTMSRLDGKLYPTPIILRPEFLEF